ncbi:MAG: hypothetical protein R2688_05485 [Fimbriimonadaceae bacterium]
MANLTDRQQHLRAGLGLARGCRIWRHTHRSGQRAMQKLVTFDSTPDLVDPMRFAYREEGDADPWPVAIPDSVDV